MFEAIELFDQAPAAGIFIELSERSINQVADKFSQIPNDKQPAIVFQEITQILISQMKF